MRVLLNLQTSNPWRQKAGYTMRHSQSALVLVCVKGNYCGLDRSKENQVIGRASEMHLRPPGHLTLSSFRCLLAGRLLGTVQRTPFLSAQRVRSRDCKHCKGLIPFSVSPHFLTGISKMALRLEKVQTRVKKRPWAYSV